MNKNIKTSIIVGFIIIIILIGGYFLFLKKSVSGNTIANINLISQITTKDSSEMVLQVSDLPEGYVLKDRAPRVKSDVSDEGLNLGWEGGYYITFMKGSGSLLDSSIIGQAISIYPIENISKTLSEPQNNENITYEKIDIEKIGDNSVAHKVTTKDGFLGDVVTYEVEFTKKNVYEDFVTAGVGNDFELLKELAKKAADKI
jgi:hypothetical protein